MASKSASAGVRNHLGTIFQFGVVGDLSDGQLLQRFLAGRDDAEQAAFAALVERHGPMVLGVCRQVLGNSHDAEDAFQATFLVMARQAHSLRNAESLASWLHGIAPPGCDARKADDARRNLHERRCAIMKAEDSESAVVGCEPCPELHEEIARLPVRYREPIVLCYLEGLTSAQAAARIGCARGLCGPGCRRRASGYALAWFAGAWWCPRRCLSWDRCRAQGQRCRGRSSIGRSGRRWPSPGEGRPRPWPPARRSRWQGACCTR